MNPDVPIADLCALIRQCGESGVSDLSFGALHVQFAPGTKRAASFEAPVHDDLGASLQTQVEQEFRADDKEALEIEELKLREHRLEMSLLENPAEFEQLLATGELDG